MWMLDHLAWQRAFEVQSSYKIIHVSTVLSAHWRDVEEPRPSKTYPDGLDMVAVALPLRLRGAVTGVWFAGCGCSEGLWF